MTEDDLKKRTKLFALRILKLVAALPKTLAGRTIVANWCDLELRSQLTIEQRGRARSKAEFISRLGVVEEEADESALWLELIMESQLMKRALVEPLWIEADEIVAIMTSSRKSAGQSLLAAKSKIKNQNSKI